ncbi:MAG: hypothetical protein CM1200mP2_22990 [Planctomycetaceae bacterium]|nr:MAG: hypothetical protein CM1200mP2_22990 [Planctomycetaceae bacterium]
MGSVYLARHAPPGPRNVALKVLGDEMSINPDMVRRFQLEGECALDLKHANLVEVYETGNDEGPTTSRRSTSTGSISEN